MTSKAHPEMNQLTDYALGRLPQDELQNVADHVSDCQECQQTLSNLADPADTLIHGLRGKAPDEAYPDEREYAEAVAAIRQFGHTPPPELTAAGARSRTDIAPGDRDLGTLRDYQLLAKLGQGGMGTVYKARHMKLDRLVALKVLPADRMQDERSVARFHREMKAVGNLDHPNIVRAHDAGEVDGKHFLVMELVDGIDLSALVEKQGRLPVADACELIRQAAVGLEHAHENGLVHRDVKPSNLMLAGGGIVKVLDLGLARLLSEAERDDDQRDGQEATSGGLQARFAKADEFQIIGDELTGTDQVMGTPDYMAPEQCTDAHRVDIRSDIYSLGATLYKLLTGHAPFTGERFDTLGKKIDGLMSQTVPPITEHRDDLPDELVAVIDRMLAKDPGDRFGTPAEVARALSSYSEGHDVGRFVATTAPSAAAALVATPPSTDLSAPQPARKASGATPPRRLWPWGLAAGAAAAIMLGVILLQLRTPYGALTVKVPDEARKHVTVRVRSGDDIGILNDQQGWKIDLVSGVWDVALEDPSDRFELKKDKVTITRNGDELVEVTLKSNQPPLKSAGREMPVPESPRTIWMAGAVTDVETITKDHVDVDQKSWRIQSNEPRTVRLFEVPKPNVDNGILTYRAKIKTEDLKGRGYLEMWCRIPGHGEAFSKALHNTVSGATGWASVETPFMLKEGERPDLIKLNFVVEGKGTVWIKDLELLFAPHAASQVPPVPIQQASQPDGAGQAVKHDAFYSAPLADLAILEGELPTYSRDGQQRRANWWKSGQHMRPYAVLDGPGEVFLRGDIRPFRNRRRSAGPLRLALRIPATRTVTGCLFVPKSDFSGMVTLKFRIDNDKVGSEDRRVFLETKRDHYEQLLQRNIPGAAWFRHQVAEMNRELGVEQAAGQTRRGNRNRNANSIRSFEILSGGLAVSENLQLDRILPAAAPESEMVPVTSIAGITVRGFDWTALTKGIDPDIDPLAQLIPDDQHALFFASFPALASAVDEAYAAGTPVLHFVEPRGEDAQTFARYQAQLGLPLTALARKLGPQFVKSVALTGSDPYLRTGTDVAILFEPKDCEELQLLLDSQIALEASKHAEARMDETLGEIQVRSVVSPDRSICSYRAMLGDTVVVTNSPQQLERIAEAFRGEEKSLAALPEYLFFRSRYPRGDADETGLLVISDNTIRRWCGPRWRIGASRRLRAAAVMSDKQAEHFVAMLADEPPLARTVVTKHQAVAGTLTVSSKGAHSPTYGTLEFLTPIVELNLDNVTTAEADMYAWRRDGYQRNWSRFFDPIAVRFIARDDKLAADVTVMPLIDNSDYREMIDVSLGAEIDPAAADPHAESIVHATLALNKDAPRVQSATNLAKQLAPEIKINPLEWIGSTISLYADKDPFWEELAQAVDFEDFLAKEVHRLPIALNVEVSDGFKLVAFLAGARAFIEQTAPGMTVWETQKHGDEPYVRVGPSERAKSRWGMLSNLSVHYAATGESLVISLSEPVLHRALDRVVARRQANADGKPTPAPDRLWLGDNLDVQMDGDFVHAVEALLHEEFDAQMRNLSWGNLPILNEWKRHFPERDPIELHEQYWHRRLICPAGGTYRWNHEMQTMESSVYGHPGQRKESTRKLPPPLDEMARGAFGLTFDENGLRARMELTKKPAE